MTSFDLKMEQYREEYGVEFAKATASKAQPNADIAAVEAMRARRMRAVADAVSGVPSGTVPALYALEVVADLAFFNAWEQRR